MPCGQVDSRSAPDHFPTRAKRNNRSGQLIWYINRSTQIVLDSTTPRCHRICAHFARHQQTRLAALHKYIPSLEWIAVANLAVTWFILVFVLVKAFQP